MGFSGVAEFEVINNKNIIKAHRNISHHNNDRMIEIIENNNRRPQDPSVFSGFISIAHPK